MVRIGSGTPSQRRVSAVGVGAVLDGDYFDLHSRLEDLADDPVVPSAGTAFPDELKL
jgi:hypothetical protein